MSLLLLVVISYLVVIHRHHYGVLPRLPWIVVMKVVETYEHHLQINVSYFFPNRQLCQFKLPSFNDNYSNCVCHISWLMWDMLHFSFFSHSI